MKAIFVKHFGWLWNNAEKILIFVFFATFAFNLRKVFLSPYSYLNGEFNEYLTMSLSWSDILVLLLIIIYIIKYLFSQDVNLIKHGVYENNKRSHLSSVLFRLQNVSHETLLFYIFLIWAATSIIWAPFKLIAIYRLFIILTLVTFLIIIRNLAKKGHLKAEIIYLGLFAGGIFQSLIGISQFALGRSLGLKILGESILGADLTGVAKVLVAGVKHIRAYGTFPHPNILAGFLVLQIILLVSLLAKRLAQDDFTNEKVSHETILSKIPDWLLSVILLINISCFLLTFSRSAFLSLFLIGLALLLINIAHSRKRFWLILAIPFFALVFLGFSYVLRHPENSLFSAQSFEERNQFLIVSRETISKHPLTGTGLGQFVFQERVSHPSWPGWQYQPVHNIYLLVASELGVTGLIFFLLFLLTFIIKYCKINCLSSLLTRRPYCIIILSFLIISFFDHYFWDIKQGMIIFAIPFILYQANRLNAKKILG